MELQRVARANSKSNPRLCASLGVKPHYRRSTTTKSPRKRTFIASMTKYLAERELASGAVNCATAFACGGTVAMLSCGLTQSAKGSEPMFELSFGTGGGNNFTGGNGGSNSGNNGWGSGGESFPFFLPAVVMGAMAALFAFPAQSLATMHATSPANSRMRSVSGSSPFLSTQQNPFGRVSLGEPGDVFGSTSSGGAYVAARKAAHISCKGGTLVVPLTGSSDQSAWSKQRATIHPLPITLTEVEHRMLCHSDHQYHAREQMRL